MSARPDPESVEAARLAALADRCVQCGLCLPHCPTYALDGLESESPRGRIAYMGALARGDLAPTPTGDRHLDHCLACLRCESTCPAGVAYGSLLTGSRAAQARRRPPSWPLRWRLALLARPRRLAGLLGAYRSLYGWLPRAARPLPRPPVGTPAAAAGAAVPKARIFAGCIAGPFEAPTRASLVRLLAAAGVTAGVPDDQGCCGAAHAHAGDADTASRLAAAVRQDLAGPTPVLCLASGCLRTLSDALAGTATVEDALAFLAARADSLAFRAAGRRRVALHLPCTARGQGASPAVRALLARVPDLDLVELPDTGCCGGAGLHAVAEPARAAQLREPLLAALAASGASELLSANIGCRLHLAPATTMPVRHPIDFLAEHLA